MRPFPRIQNYSTLPSRAACEVALELAHINSIDRLACYTGVTAAPLELIRQMALSRALHEIVAVPPSGCIAITFRVTCDGEILVATLWDHVPAPEQIFTDFAATQHLDPLPDRIFKCRFDNHSQQVSQNPEARAR